MTERTARYMIYLLILIFAVLVEILTTVADPHGMQGIGPWYGAILKHFLGGDDDLTSLLSKLEHRP